MNKTKEITTMHELQGIARPLGMRIRVARENAHLSQEQLGQKIGVSESSIIAWENDERQPRANRMMTLAGVLGVSANWLILGRQDELMEEHHDSALLHMRGEIATLRGLLNEANSVLARLTKGLAEIENADK